MSFFLLLFSSALASALNVRRIAPKVARDVLGASIGVLVQVLISGVVRLSLATSGPFVKVGLAALHLSTDSPMASEGEPTAKLIRNYVVLERA